jgi:hypothetical protein
MRSTVIAMFLPVALAGMLGGANRRRKNTEFHTVLAIAATEPRSLN